MKKLITILSFLVVTHLQGQFLVRLSGKVAGFKAVSGTKYIGDQTLAITGTVTLASNVTFDFGGGSYTGTGAVFTTQAAVSNDSVLNLNVSGASEVFDGHSANYTGRLYSNIYARNITLSRGTMLYNGTWSGPRTMTNLCVGLYADSVKVIEDTAHGNMVVWGNSIYQFTANHWNVSGESKHFLVDNGVIQIESGNGQILNSYRNAKSWGYWMRILGQAELIGLTGNQDSKILNTVDANTICYGTFDGRNDTTRLIPGKTVGGDIWFQNNTSANKSDLNAIASPSGGYVTNAAIVGAMYGYTFHIDSCIAFNAQYRTDGKQAGSSLVKDNSSGSGKILMHNNIDIAPGLPVTPGFVDANFYSLKKGIGVQGTLIFTPPLVRYCTGVSVWGGTATFTYNDGSVSTLVLTNPIIIK